MRRLLPLPVVGKMLGHRRRHPSRPVCNRTTRRFRALSRRGKSGPKEAESAQNERQNERQPTSAPRRARRAVGDVGRGQNGLACTALFRRWQTTQAPYNAARGLVESAHARRVYSAAQDLKRCTRSLRPVHLKKWYCDHSTTSP